MKALQLVDAGEFSYGDFEDPKIENPGDVVVEVRACGICGSDVHGMDLSSGRRRPPIIMGHEATGVVKEIGSAVSDWKPGDRVTFDSTVYCGECGACESGDVNLCDSRRVLGVSCEDYRQHGALAEYLKVPSRILYRLPDDLDFRRGAFAEPVSIALHAVRLLPETKGKTAVVVGAGLIGLLVVQALKLAGCDSVIAVDVSSSRLDLALELGASHVFLSEGEKTVAEIKALCGGDGADIAMEVVGITPTLDAAVRSVSKGGVVGLVGNIAPMAELPLQWVVTREITLVGSCSCAGEYPDALRHISSGAIRVEPLLSEVTPLSEAADWFQRLYDDSGDLMKIVVEPDNVFSRQS